MTEFTGIEGVSAWRKKLKELLRDAEKAAKGDNSSARRKQVKRLTYFVMNSRPNTEEIRMMDDIAAKVARDLSKQNMDERVASIIARTAEYAKLEKDVNAQAEINEETAKALRLEVARKTVGTLTEAMHLLKELRMSIKEGEETSFLKRLDKLSKELKDFRDKLESEE
jgi:hypothetical protein